MYILLHKVKFSRLRFGSSHVDLFFEFVKSLDDPTLYFEILSLLTLDKALVIRCFMSLLTVTQCLMSLLQVSKGGFSAHFL